MSSDTYKFYETKIAELQETYKEYATWEVILGELKVFKEILSSAIILPVEESWDEVYEKTFSQAFVEKDYPNGLIIQPI
jgi:oligoribonuclease NrnB/cAMP/cGMP phosphodiesterase (DHH superfamily)